MQARERAKDSIRGRRSCGFPEHLCWIAVLIECLCFALLPFFQCDQFLKLVASEEPKHLFFWCGWRHGAHVKVRTKKESADLVCEGSVALLDRIILTRVVRANGMDGMPFLCEEVLCFGVIEQLPSLAQMHTLVGAVQIVLAKEV